ncbi:cation:dicarboxylase symporter family transporter [Planctomycetota bacterium]|nr:cation:dicarboxylase symporter family transporter [Planctomycetota bacterium]
MKDGDERRRLSFSQRVLLGAALGVATGLFLGELAAPGKWLGDAYVGLLQMTVLPYVVVSLVANIAKLSSAGGRRLVRCASGALGLLWLTGLLTLPLLALAFPAWEVGSFYSSSSLESPPAQDYQQLYIPSNPFAALAGGLIPAVALFCILAGAVSITMPGKERLIELLDLVAEMLTRLNRWVVQLTPLGVFGIAAQAAGTLTIGQLSLLQGYLITIVLGVGLLAFGVLPLLASALTPLRYREIMAAAKEPLLTAFVTGSTFVTLPMIVAGVEKLLASRKLEAGVEPSALVALAYPFPHLGKILSLLFVPFAAWFYGSPMAAGDYPEFLTSGLLGSFGSLVVTIPMLLEQQQIPADVFQLFLLSGVVAARTCDVLGTMGILVFSVLASVWMAGGLGLRPQRLVGGGLGLAAVGALLVGGTHAHLATGFIEAYGRHDVLATMVSAEPSAVMAIRLDSAEPNPDPLRPGESRLDRIRRRGTLRVGVAMDHLPFSFLNREGDLVGLDVDMAHRLALDLGPADRRGAERGAADGTVEGSVAGGLTLELVPLDLSRLREQAEMDSFDVAMSGIELTLRRSERVDLTVPYLTVTAALVVEDHRRAEFSSLEKIAATEGLRVAVWRGGYASERVAQRLVDVEGIELVELDRLGDFFESTGAFDMLVTSAEVGSAWTLRYPQYAVVQALKERTGVPLVYAIPGRDPEFRQFLNHWIQLRTASGTVERLRRYWILGDGAEPSAPRWSVVRNVLGWVE